MSCFEFRQLTSLSKVFPKKIYGQKYKSGIVCKGEDYSFQLAVRADKETDLTVSFNSSLQVKISRVAYVPSKVPAYSNSTCPKALHANHIRTWIPFMIGNVLK